MSMSVDFEMNSKDEVNLAASTEQPTVNCNRKQTEPETNKAEEEEESETEAEAIEPSDGCLIIGNNGNKYFTRNLTDFVEQTNLINGEIVNSEYFPCCRKVKDKGSIAWKVLGTFRNEMFLYFLHLIVICLGVIKESLVVTGAESTDVARLVYTCVETTTTVVLIFMRTINAWIAYSAMRKDTARIGFYGRGGGVDGGPGRMIEAALSVRRFFRLYLLAAGVLLLLCTTTFVACLSVDQLEWTVLSNIVCIITVNLLSSLYAVRVSRTMNWVREDAHRVALLEAVFLIRSSCSRHGPYSSSTSSDVATSAPVDDFSVLPPPTPPSPPYGRKRRLLLLERFADAVECSEFFQRPSYINVSGCNRQTKQTPDICTNL